MVTEMRLGVDCLQAIYNLMCCFFAFHVLDGLRFQLPPHKRRSIWRCLTRCFPTLKLQTNSAITASYYRNPLN